jgi:hypothetical protein
MRHRRRHTRQPEPELGSDREHLQLRPERRRRKRAPSTRVCSLAQARSAGIAALAGADSGAPAGFDALREQARGNGIEFAIRTAQKSGGHCAGARRSQRASPA